ncbi:hypothetical protein C8A03DRAFT_17964, partial [Achaetomium macrosporum]
VLADYELHHSEPSAEVPRVEPRRITAGRPVDREAGTRWPTDQRRVPPYRPVNRHLDLSQRTVYNDRMEQLLIMTMYMYFGIRIIAHRMWRATGEKPDDTIFRYDVGGEY